MTVVDSRALFRGSSKYEKWETKIVVAIVKWSWFRGTFMLFTWKVGEPNIVFVVVKRSLAQACKCKKKVLQNKQNQKRKKGGLRKKPFFPSIKIKPGKIDGKVFF
jgi:hypothetical protein